jgi:serine/threonine-protein kinase
MTAGSSTVSCGLRGTTFHCNGLLHRDVKPANIMLTKPDADDRRRALPGDFGIARSAEDVSGLSFTNTTVHTAHTPHPNR